MAVVTFIRNKALPLMKKCVRNSRWNIKIELLTCLSFTVSSRVNFSSENGYRRAWASNTKM